MPPYDNRMQAPVSQMGPGGQLQMPGGGMDPAMITQLMQRYAQMQGQGGQSAPFSQMGPGGGMQNMNPDQGMNQAPLGWGGGGAMPGSMPAGWQDNQRRADESSAYWGSQGPGRIQPKPMMTPGGSMPGGSGPFLPPGMDPGQGQLNQKPMFRDMRGQMPPQAPPMPPQAPPAAAPSPGPPRMRMPPGAGVWKNPGTGQMMNQTPIFSGARNPADVKQDTPGAPQTGGVMNGPADDMPTPKDPIRVAPNPMVANSDKIRPKQQPGAPPFNPNGPGVSAQAPTEPGMVNQPWQKESQKKQGLARAMTSRVTKSNSVR